MEMKEKCKVPYCNNTRNYGKNGQLMDYCHHHKLLNLIVPSATWRRPHLFYKAEIIFNNAHELKCNYDIWGDGTKCGDSKLKYLSVPDIDKKWIWGMFDVDHIKPATEKAIKNNPNYYPLTGKVEHPSNYQLLCKDCHRIKSHRNGDYNGVKNKKKIKLK